MNRLIENKMEKPSLKEVKEYFKNAKIVICVCDGKKYNVTLNNIKELVYNYVIMDDCANVDLVLWSPDKGYAEIVEYKDSVLEELPGIIAPEHYDNTKGTLYKFCEEKGLNSYEFDIIKRVMRCRKKGVFIEDLQKTKVLIDLYIQEHGKK